MFATLAVGACTLAAQTKGSRGSGQSKLMDGTFAGKNACNPDDHLRPFIIEWDATDMSSFEQYAANDIIFVKYEGCSLRVLDECRNESIRGEQGAYKPVEWTSGALETLDINNSAELYAKLPLGNATLGGRVEGGERFHMEYYVAGTRTASRDAVYQDDLTGRYGCESATHFVHGYNLGAFALGSSKNVKASAGGSAFGFGAGGSETRESSAEKRGGKLTTCESESAKEVEGCKAPIRLTLRPIRRGENPEKGAMRAPENAESMSAAAVINTKMAISDEARAHLEAAQRMTTARDGKACLKELDAHDKLDAKHKSSDSKSPYSLSRSMCLMLAGQCDAGKSLARKSLEQADTMQAPAEQRDAVIEAYGTMWCQGKLNDRDALLQAIAQLNKGAYQGDIGVKSCTDHAQTVKKLRGKVKPKDDDDTQVKDLDRYLYALVPACFQRAGDCKLARKSFDELFPVEYLAWVTDPAQRTTMMTSNFESMVPKCKGK